MTTPNEVWDYDLKTRARTLAQAPGGAERARSVGLRDAAPARDGARRRDRPDLDPASQGHQAATARAPCLLYGYGAYGYAMPASFATGRLSLVDRGFVYAIAHVRGGTEKGWHWYQDGKLAKKTNTFTDFIAAAEHLRAQGLRGAAGSSRMAARPAAC